MKKQIVIQVIGKPKTGKSTIMEMINDKLKQHFRVESISMNKEPFPPNAFLSKRIDCLKKEELEIVIVEKPASIGE